MIDTWRLGAEWQAAMPSTRRESHAFITLIPTEPIQSIK
ncbi:hypothetical protein OH687_13695 [Burkholderia anthina]|nr:hypothetical protein OH687_13695 [Burkholderia anthina]